jgi:hypothetical protein
VIIFPDEALIDRIQPIAAGQFPATLPADTLPVYGSHVPEPWMLELSDLAHDSYQGAFVALEVGNNPPRPMYQHSTSTLTIRSREDGTLAPSEFAWQAANLIALRVLHLAYGYDTYPAEPQASVLTHQAAEVAVSVYHQYFANMAPDMPREAIIPKGLERRNAPAG